MAVSRPNLRLVAVSFLAAIGLYAGFAVGFSVLARWAEARFEAYPYLAGEDPIRLLLPTVHAAPDGGTLLLGPSALREGILYEDLEHRWGSRVRSGGLSSAVLDDCNLVLSYLERVYGVDALPRRIVLGMEPYSLGNWPRHFGPRRESGDWEPTIQAIDRYSTHFRVARGELGTHLVPKTALEANKARLRFYFGKQQPRYVTGVLAAIEHAFDSDPLKVGFEEGIPSFSDDPRLPFAKGNIATSVSFVREHAGDAVQKWLRLYRSPYMSMFASPQDDPSIIERIEFYSIWYVWDPREEEAMVSSQLDRIADFVNRHGIELIVLYLPEHPLLRARYDKERYAAYQHAIERHLPMARFVDLFDAIPREHFNDSVHINYEGARKATSLFLQAVPNGPEPTK